MNNDWFKNPSALNRPAPLWVWNDRMDKTEIAWELQQLKDHGFGGAFVHPRFGMLTPYLSEEWFELWRFSLETAKKLGLKLYIYDENTYPSGYAGGHVSAEMPDCVATSAAYRLQPSADFASAQADWKSLIKAFACEKREDGSLRIIRDLYDLPAWEWPQQSEWVITIRLVKPETLPWLGDCSYVDVMQPGVTQKFLETTYESYYQRFGKDFGKAIPAIFSDEPGVSGSGIYKWGEADNQPFSYWLAAEFQKRNGYSLLDHLPAVFENVECDWFVKPAVKVRYDFCCTVQQLWTENFMIPMYRWCQQHHIAWTGHFLEEYWPSVASSTFYGDVMANYEYMQWPGIDMLMTALYKHKATDQMRLVILQLASVGSQLPKEQLLCESYGAGGWDASLDDFKRIGDFLLVNGVTFINQHLVLSTYAGSRKRDHPQSFDWREPWWDEYALLNDYTSRAAAVLNRGRSRQRVLLLHPTTTSYIERPFYYPSQLQQGDIPAHPAMGDYLRLIQLLTDRQYDFDLGNESIMARHGRAADGRLTVGEQDYDVVVCSGDMKNMCQSTVDLLHTFLDSGGTVVSLGTPGDYVDGENKPEVFASLFAHTGWKQAKSEEEWERLMKALLQPRLAADSPFPTGFCHRRRELENGMVAYFLVNHSMETFETTLRLKGGSVEEWDLVTGERCSLFYCREGNVLSIPLSMPRCRSILLMVYPDSEAQPAAPEITHRWRKLDCRSDMRQEDPNILLVDYLDLLVDGKTYEDISYLQAAELLFRHRGFNGNPWELSIQYKSRMLEKNDFGKGSGFTLRYHFQAAESFVPGNLILAAERPSLFTLQVNDRPIPWLENTNFLDRHMGCANIASVVRPGLNTVELTASVFDITAEPEAICLRGNFSLEDHQNQWTLVPETTLSVGSLPGQGRPFYTGALVCETVFHAEADGESIRLLYPQLDANGCSIIVNGRFAGLAGVDGDSSLDLTPYLIPGENRVTLRVSIGLRNLLGPHHMFENQRLSSRNTAFPAYWAQMPRKGQPPAAAYDCLPYGILEFPVLEIGE